MEYKIPEINLDILKGAGSDKGFLFDVYAQNNQRMASMLNMENTNPYDRLPKEIREDFEREDEMKKKKLEEEKLAEQVERLAKQSLKLMIDERKKTIHERLRLKLLSKRGII